jgi:hypothetical protein
VSVTSAQPLTGPTVWRGEDLTRSTDWIRAITTTEVARNMEYRYPDDNSRRV